MARPSRDMERVTLYLPSKELKKLRDLAYAQDRAYSSVIRIAIREYLKKIPQADPTPGDLP